MYVKYILCKEDILLFENTTMIRDLNSRAMNQQSSINYK